MAKIDLTTLDDDQKSKLVEARWTSSSSVWDIVVSVYKLNTAIYENKSDWVNNLPFLRKNWLVHANRVFVNMEAVINSLIANPPGINILPSREGEPAQDFARKLEAFLRKKFTDLNVKETMRMGYRNLYFGRLIVIKAFWNPTINDFDFRAIDPRKVRFAKYARKEQDSEFAIEEIDDNLCAVCDRFPAKKEELMKKFGITTEADLYIKNPDITYKEAWIGDYVVFKYQEIILDTIKNPYWDWEGILITEEEETQLGNGEGSLEGDARRQLLQQIKLEQDQRKPATPQPEQQKGIIAKSIDAVKNIFAPDSTTDNPAQPVEDPNNPTPQPVQYKQYFFNYFDNPRKPYIYATIFNNENTPIGRTDMITLSATLQRGIDKRKIDIDENCELVNGILKVDASVMGKSDAQRIRFETKGIIWGKNVKDGVLRETGTPLPQMVFDDMNDSRSEIDNIMAASSAFRGEREGQETKAGRLALIQQSFLRLNELVQLGDYVSKEIFDWSLQLVKTRYTEYHSAELLNKEGEREAIELIQDDIEVGNKVTIIAGKSLPVDDEWKFEQAQNDVKEGYISPPDYLEIAKYDNAKELSKNAVMYHLSPVSSVGMTQEELAKIPPPLPQASLKESIAFDDLPASAKVQVLGRMGITVTEDQIIGEGNPSPVSIAFKDLPPDAQVQVLQKQGIIADPNILVAEKMAANHKDQVDTGMKIDAQKHSQMMAEKGHELSVKQVKQPKPNETK